MAPNVEGYLTNLARLIGDEVDLDLIVDHAPPPALHGSYRVHRTRLRAPSRGLRRLESVLALRRYATRERPDALTHVSNFETLGVAVAIAGRLTGTPTITRYAGQALDAYQAERGLLRRLKLYLMGRVVGRLALRLSDRLLAVGPRLSSDLVRHGAPAARVVTIPQPLDREVFHPARDRAAVRAVLDLPHDRRIVLYVGRLEWLKGVDSLLRVAPQALAQRPELYFCFVGAGQYEAALRTLGAGFDLRGAVPRQQVADYYRAADLLVLPSRTEGPVPNVLLEALACGTAVASRPVGDVALATRQLFDSDDDLLRLLLRDEWPTEPVPAGYADEELRERYLELLHTTVEHRR